MTRFPYLQMVLILFSGCALTKARINLDYAPEKNIGTFDIQPSRADKIIDIFSYGAQILAAIGIAGTTMVTPFEIMKHLYTPI